MKDDKVEELQLILNHIHTHLMWGPTGKDKLRFLSLALCGEAGELANFVKKEWRGDNLDRKGLIEEVADVANYLYMIADVLGIDLHKEMLKKLKKVEKRHNFKKVLDKV